ncbi:DUF6157 family protein [Paenibacillus sp. 22594]|uniref:DUF6157 family protein n=1 Tax=Paenibacillus sp. 22594 TaxID=3453947 RepID=UPI003F863EAE
MMPKRYGWGIHYNREGKIALYGKESPEYDHFTSGKMTKRSIELCINILKKSR